MAVVTSTRKYEQFPTADLKLLNPADLTVFAQTSFIRNLGGTLGLAISGTIL